MKANNSWTFYAARKYLFSKRNKQRSTLILSSLGLILGIVTIITVISIMNGLQQGYLSDLMEIESYHLSIGPLDRESAEEIQSLLDEKEHIVHTAIYNEREIMLIPEGRDYTPVKIRGMQKADFLLDRKLAEHLEIQAGTMELQKMDNVTIGSGLAKKTGLAPGDAVKLITVVPGEILKIIPSVKHAEISGVFSSRYPEIDNMLCFTSRETLEDMGVAEYYIGVKTDDPFSSRLEAAAAVPAVHDTEKAEIITWKERYDSFYAALMMEKYSMYIILFLIFLVISVNIRSTFERFIFEKRHDFGMLKAIGAKENDLRSILLYQGIFLLIITAVVGTVSGILFSTHINTIMHAAGLLLKQIFGFDAGIEYLFFPVEIAPLEIVFTIIIMSGMVLWSVNSSIRILNTYTPMEIIRYE